MRSRSPHPHPIDVHVGARLRQRRTQLGISQEKLAAALGLTFQQVQKYERAANRIGASRLFELARVLNVPVEYFFDGLDPAALEGGGPRGVSEGPRAAYEAPLALNRDQTELITAFQRIGDQATRRHLVGLARALGTSSAAREGA